MRIICISTDRKLFTPGSAVAGRMARMANLYGDVIDSIVFSTRAHGYTDSKQITSDASAHPTNSRSRFLYGKDAIAISKRLSRPDVVSAQDPFETGLVALCIARYWKVPLAVEIHTDFLAPSFIKHSLLNRLRVLLAGYVLRKATQAYTVSQSVKKAVLDRYKLMLPISVLPIYIDTQYFSSLTHTPHPRFETDLLWVGRMEQEKHPEVALNTLITLRKKGFSIGLTFVGNGRLLESLKRKAEVGGVTKWVEYIGSVSDVGPHYAQADLLLVTSAYEGYSMVIIEALAAHLPVLSADVGIAKEAGAMIVKDNYVKTISEWLSGPRAAGVLRSYPYINEADYFSQMHSFYLATASKIKS